MLLPQQLLLLLPLPPTVQAASSARQHSWRAQQPWSTPNSVAPPTRGRVVNPLSVPGSIQVPIPRVVCHNCAFVQVCCCSEWEVLVAAPSHDCCCFWLHAAVGCKAEQGGAAGLRGLALAARDHEWAGEVTVEVSTNCRQRYVQATDAGDAIADNLISCPIFKCVTMRLMEDSMTSIHQETHAVVATLISYLTLLSQRPQCRCTVVHQ
jgi:hypothetical protein